MSRMVGKTINLRGDVCKSVKLKEFKETGVMVLCGVKITVPYKGDEEVEQSEEIEERNGQEGWMV